MEPTTCLKTQAAAMLDPLPVNTNNGHSARVNNIPFCISIVSELCLVNLLNEFIFSSFQCFITLLVKFLCIGTVFRKASLPLSFSVLLRADFRYVLFRCLVSISANCSTWYVSLERTRKCRLITFLVRFLTRRHCSPEWVKKPLLGVYHS